MELSAYFKRIGYDGPRAPTIEVLRALHARHPAAIAFENLDPLLGRPVVLDPASLETKLVHGGRGGYCFEQNGLFLLVLTALGFSVTPLAARVRWMLPEEVPQTPLSHMLLKASLEDGDYLCDVGFGGQSPTAPLRLQPDLEQQTPHGTYRLRNHGAGLELQMRLADGWHSLYRFNDEAQTARDYEVFNWYTSTHPASRFVNNLVAARVIGERRLALFNRELVLQHGDGRREHRLLANSSDVHAILSGEFGIQVEPAEIERIWQRLPA